MNKHRNSMACVAVLLLWAAAVPVAANDGTYYTKGNHLVPLQETDISVKKEVLTISLMDDGFARVDVQYEFWNPGAARCVTVGFEADPPYNSDYRFHPDGRHPNMAAFTVDMNGRRLAHRTAACVADSLPLHRVDTTVRYCVWDNNWLYDTALADDRYDYFEPRDYDAGFPFTYVYYFEAEFQPGLNRLHHSYTYRMSTIVGIPFRVDYKLTPAARWAGGCIDDFTLTIRVDSTAKHFYVFDSVFGGAPFTVSEGMGKTRRSAHFDHPTEVSLRNGAVTLHKSRFVPTAELVVTAVGVDGLYGEGDVFRLAGTYDRTFGGLLHFEPYKEMKVEPADKALRQRVVRNLPYADRGHVFRDRRLRRYFESLWWYMPDPDYKDATADFTPVDWQYVRYKE